MSNDYDAGDGYFQPGDYPPTQQQAAPARHPLEGRTASNAKGQKIIMRNGLWENYVPTGPQPAPPPANAAQAKLRVLTADQPVAGDEMNRLMAEPDPGRDGKPTRPNMWANAVDTGVDLPLGIKIHSHGIANIMRDDQEQTLDSAGQQWITSAAHALSGARIGQEQLHQLLVAYLPAATDKPGNTAFKAAQRQRLEEGIAEASGLPGKTMDPAKADALVTILKAAPPAEQARPAASSYLQQGPKVGEVQDGYMFKGGNAGDPHSWVPVAPSHGTGR